MKTNSKAGNMSGFTFYCCWALVIGSIVPANGRLAPAFDLGEAGEWHTTLWEACEPEKVFEHLPNGPVAPIVGLQRRTVTCVSSNATVLSDSYCRDTAVSQRRCVVTQRCQVDSWSPWETSQHGCRGDDDQILPDIQMRRRRIVQAPMGPTRAEMDIQTQCPALQEVRIVQDPAELPLCSQRYKWQHSPWSPCRPETSAGSSDAEGAVCGGGIQFRSLSCFRLNDSRPVHQRLCRGLAKLPVVQHCEIPCDLDCQVTSWSPWSSCIGSSCHLSASTDSTEMEDERLERYWSGYRLRNRRAVSNASAGGVECPPLAQAQRCRSPFSGCTRWQVRPLETCHLSAANATCGPGYQDVVFQCQRFDGTTLDDQMCANVTLPATNQVPCRVVCSTDCVLSEWSNWTRCSESDGKRRRWRHVIGYPMAGAAPCPPLAELVQEEMCSPVEREPEPVFSWWSLPWTECMVANRSHQMSLAASSPCGTGYQEREVRCISNDVEHVDDSWCSVLPEKPVSWRTCDVPCPVDCQTSPWSEWSACSSADALEESIQTRMRVVLAAPSSGGSPCPPLIEKRSCFDRIVHGSAQDYHWHVSANWTPCQLSPEAKCGAGIATRSAYCRDASNRTVDPALCLTHLADSYWSLQLHRECHVPCPHRRCSSSSDPLQSAPPCTRNCMGIRKRRERSLSDDGTEGCPYGDVSEDCPCERITLETEEWSQCLLDDQRTCGAGRQFRRRKCTVTATGQLAPLHWCNEDDYETRYCEVACPIDCQMSPWSKWTPCNSICGPGIQRRHRSILVEPLHDGRPCGQVEEIQPCESHPCDLYQWQLSDWTPCYLDDSRCGTSTQHRTVRCVNVLEDMMVHEALCDPANKPATSQTCEVACPGECVLTPWSAWSPCNKCQGSRSRQRSIIRNPIYNRTCGPLEEIQPCSIEFRNCWTYEWQVSDWGSCIPLGGSQCGEGTQARALSCVRNDGYPVHHSHCDSYTRPALTEQWCTVECPIDCQLSPWSPWNQSECTCGNHFGVQIRQRQILIDGNAYGRQCPPILRQHLPCPYRPCYDWRPSNWTQCLLQGGQCGKGVRRQMVDCVLVETQKKVDPEFCLMGGRSWPEASESPCSVPCLFEMAVKIGAESVSSAASVLPTTVEDEIRVFYYPSDEEFNIWMVAMIGMGSLFLVFVGVTIFLICSSKNDPGRNKQSTSAMTTQRPTEFRTTRGRQPSQQLPEA